MGKLFPVIITSTCLITLLSKSELIKASSWGRENCPLDNTMDYVKLAVQWQTGYCERSGCRSEPRFSIHGLWPGRNSNKFMPSDCCANDQFDAAKLEALKPRLMRAWPSLTGTHAGFWRHEYQKHGTCTRDLSEFGGLVKYFEKTLQLFESLNLDQSLLQANIQPNDNRPIDKQILVRTLTKNTQNRRPDLDCERGRTGSYLKEIRFCFEQTSLQPVDCPQAMDDCAAQVLLLD